MFRKDSFAVGAITGIIFSALMYFIFTELNKLLTGTLMPAEQGFSDQFIAILAICSNIFPFLFYNSANKYYSMRGILGVTTLGAIIIIAIYRNQFF